MTFILLLQCAVTFAMTGLIWFVQMIHYPLFSVVGSECFQAYEHLHQRRTTWVVAPLMLIEVGCATAAFWGPPELMGPVMVSVGACLLALIWISTFFLQVPEHRRLARSYDKSSVKRLVLGNWIRTIAWSLRSLLMLIVLQNALAI